MATNVYRVIRLIVFQAVFLLVAVSLSFHRIKSNIFPFSTHPSHDFLHLAGHCAHVTPVSSLEFLARQQALAETLYSLNASAYIAEPGPSAHYYANISTWGLSERPLLLIISPQLDGTTVKPNVSILTPYFEKTRFVQSHVNWRLSTVVSMRLFKEHN